MRKNANNNDGKRKSTSSGLMPTTSPIRSGIINKADISSKGKTMYNVNGTMFEVDAHYEVHKAIGYGAYGFVVYVHVKSGIPS